MGVADVEAAYLNSDLEEEVYIGIPEGQAGLAWTTKLPGTLDSLGFQQMAADQGAYIRQSSTGLAWVLTWVDGLVIFAKDKGRVDQILGDIGKSFTLTSLNLLAKKGRDDATRYKEMVGGLLFVAMGTRPDIAYALGYLGRHQTAPTEKDWEAGLRVITYLKYTAGWALCYRQHGGHEQEGWSEGFCDVDEWIDLHDCWGGCELTESMAGHCRHVEHRAEYITLAKAVKETLWLQELLTALKGTESRPIKITCDSQGPQAVAKRPVSHQRMKHIAMRWYFIGDVINQRPIEMVDGRSPNMVDDGLTKAFPQTAHEKHIKSMGLLADRQNGCQTPLLWVVCLAKVSCVY
ncbi:MAG: hypothetical protein BJ554DRAFT_7583 [Olpidium bornovanus]|uniref:Reverse transcriptase Ty1/copia-type domain-containing protein n=1 Tax=Olpidium bornovanus TaxID=278681 RepID=A0A8H7ZW71_9FUNG|nr:MAG: hypothetical protein BJ554DRAFT_7583 [Olpidium bornovanus]